VRSCATTSGGCRRSAQRSTCSRGAGRLEVVGRRCGPEPAVVARARQNVFLRWARRRDRSRTGRCSEQPGDVPRERRRTVASPRSRARTESSQRFSLSRRGQEEIGDAAEALEGGLGRPSPPSVPREVAEVMRGDVRASRRRCGAGCRRGGDQRSGLPGRDLRGERQPRTPRDEDDGRSTETSRRSSQTDVGESPRLRSRPWPRTASRPAFALAERRTAADEVASQARW